MTAQHVIAASTSQVGVRGCAGIVGLPGLPSTVYAPPFSPTPLQSAVYIAPSAASLGASSLVSVGFSPSAPPPSISQGEVSALLDGVAALAAASLRGSEAGWAAVSVSAGTGAFSWPPPGSVTATDEAFVLCAPALSLGATLLSTRPRTDPISAALPPALPPCGFNASTENAAAALSSAAAPALAVSFGATAWAGVSAQMQGSAAIITTTLLWGIPPAPSAAGWADARNVSGVSALRAGSHGLDSRVLSITLKTEAGVTVSQWSGSSPASPNVSSASAVSISLALPAAGTFSKAGSGLVGPFVDSRAYSVTVACFSLSASVVLGDPVSARASSGASVSASVAALSYSGVTPAEAIVRVDCGIAGWVNATCALPSSRGDVAIVQCPSVEWIPACGYWDVSSLAWSTRGCVAAYVSGASSLTCVCTHLTDFGARFVAVGAAQQALYVPPNVAVSRNGAPLWALLSILCIAFAGAIAWGSAADSAARLVFADRILRHPDIAADSEIAAEAAAALTAARSPKSRLCLGLCGGRSLRPIPKADANAFSDAYARALYRRYLNLISGRAVQPKKLSRGASSLRLLRPGDAAAEEDIARALTEGGVTVAARDGSQAPRSGGYRSGSLQLLWRLRRAIFHVWFARLIARHPLLGIWSYYDLASPRVNRTLFILMGTSTSLFFSAFFYAYRNGTGALLPASSTEIAALVILTASIKIPVMLGFA